MRTILTTIALFFFMFFVFPVSAQTAKGSLLLGGNGNISFISRQDIKDFGFNLSPRVGYFVS